MSVRPIPKQTVLSATISTNTPVISTPFYLGQMFSACAAYIVTVGTGLTATFKVMVSMDGLTFYDSGQVLPASSGSAVSFPVQYTGSFPYVAIEVVQSGGSGTVTIVGSAKGGA